MRFGEPVVFEMTVPSRMEELEAVRRLAEEAVRVFGLDADVGYWVELAINESTINAIQHGNRSDPAKTVFLRISSDGRTIEVVVEDQGKGFNLEDVPDPTNAENLLKPGGRGILIIQSFMDQVEVTSRQGGGTRIRMTKNLETRQQP